MADTNTNTKGNWNTAVWRAIVKTIREDNPDWSATAVYTKARYAMAKKGYTGKTNAATAN